MDLRGFLGAMYKNWWLVGTAVILAVGFAAVVSLTTTPRYAARVTFFITTPHGGVADAYQGGLFSEQRVSSYVELLTSDRLAKAVVANHPVGLSADEVRQRISANAHRDTVLLEATVTDQHRD